MAQKAERIPSLLAMLDSERYSVYPARWAIVAVGARSPGFHTDQRWPANEESPRMQRPNQRSRLLGLAAALLIVATVAGSFVLYRPVRAQDDSPVGEWSVAITRTDVPVDIASSFSYVGRWRLGIDADGTYQAERLDVGATVITGSLDRRWRPDHLHRRGWTSFLLQRRGRAHHRRRYRHRHLFLGALRQNPHPDPGR